MFFYKKQEKTSANKISQNCKRLSDLGTDTTITQTCTSDYGIPQNCLIFNHSKAIAVMTHMSASA